MLVYSTHFSSQIRAMGVSSFGDVYVAGLAFNGLTVQNAIQPEPNHLGDAFVAKIADASGSSVDNTILVSLRTGHIQEYNVAGGFTRDIVGGDDGAASFQQGAPVAAAEFFQARVDGDGNFARGFGPAGAVAPAAPVRSRSGSR